MHYNFIMICQPRICGLKRIVKNEKLELKSISVDFDQFKRFSTYLSLKLTKRAKRSTRWPFSVLKQVFLYAVDFICRFFESVFFGNFCWYDAYRIGHSI